jgi:CheY-like chemotaxis protein
MMADSTDQFGRTAKALAHNPLGIIALFIVLVYGFAALVTGFGGSLTSQERLPLIYFLIIFPVLVLGVFAWLVSRHSGKLFAPSDFKNEDNYVKMQMSVIASLTAAASKDVTSDSPDLKRIVEVAQATDTKAVAESDGWQNCVLWVDDRPENNTYERQAFEAIGLKFTLALSTEEAMNRIATQKYAVIISDMGRREGPREGYVLLDRLRAMGNQPPLFFYAASSAPEHKRETQRHGGQGCTSNAQELFAMVTQAIAKQKREA